jgi:elongation factor G
MAAVAVPLDAAGAAVALAFKVVYDRRSKKPLVWLRTYAGELAPGVTMFNGRNGLEERPTRLVQMHGEETVDLQSVGPGAICAAVGLRHTRTGDTLVVRPAAEWAEIALQPALRVPTPVFFTAVEVGSAVQQPALDAALEALCLEVRSPLIALVAAECALHHDLRTIFS